MRQSLESLYDSGGEGGGGYYDYYAQPTYTPVAAPAPAYAAPPPPAPAPAPATAQAFTGNINTLSLPSGWSHNTAYNELDWNRLYSGESSGSDTGDSWGYGQMGKFIDMPTLQKLGYTGPTSNSGNPNGGSYVDAGTAAYNWMQQNGYGVSLITNGAGDYRGVVDKQGNILGASPYNSYQESWANILAPLMLAGAAPLAGVFAGGAAPGVLANAAAGATINAGVTALDGGSLSDILKAGATGGITAGAGSALKDFISGGDINWGMTGSSTPVYDPVADYMKTGGVEGSLLSGLDGAGGIFYNPNIKQLESSPLQEAIYDLKPLEPLEPINAQPMPDIPTLGQLYPDVPLLSGNVTVDNWNTPIPAPETVAFDIEQWLQEQQAVLAQEQALYANNPEYQALYSNDMHTGPDNYYSTGGVEGSLQSGNDGAGGIIYNPEPPPTLRAPEAPRPSGQEMLDQIGQVSREDLQTLAQLYPDEPLFQQPYEQVIKTLSPSPLQEAVYDIKPLEPLAPLGLGAGAGALGDLLKSSDPGSGIPSINDIVKGIGTVGTIDKLLGGGGSSGGGGTVGIRPPGAGTGTGAGGGTALGGLINALLGDGTNTNSGLLGMYLGGKLADKSNSEINTQLDVLKNMYGQDSPYAKQMQQVLERKDAAAGRNSQYGPREVELQARLAEATTRNAPMIKSLYDQKQANRNLAASTLSNNPLVGNVLKSLSDSGNGSILEGIKRLFNSGPDGAEQAQRLVDSGIFNQLSSTPYTGLDTGNLSTSTPSTSIGDYLSNTNSPYTSPTGTLPSYLGDQSTDWFTGYGGAPTSGGYNIDPNWWQTPSAYDWGTSSGAYTGIDPNSLPSVFWNDPMLYNNERVGEQDSDWWKNLFGNEEP